MKNNTSMYINTYDLYIAKYAIIIIPHETNP